ncbi:MAG: site-specific DNA-methyltransferase [Firmicutes bacterium]|nr:site-specific DNA-methyltransferase [Bacillota bacterium]
MGRLFVGTCTSMTQIADGGISLVVTSPPYWNAIDYDAHTHDPGAWYRTRREDVTYAQYLAWLEACFAECWRTLHPGGFCAIVVGTVLHNGLHYPLPFHLVGIIEKIGYRFHEDIIWNKVTGGVKRAGVTIQHPYPGYYYPNMMNEHILIFRKPGPKLYEGKSPADLERARIPVDEVFKLDIANSVWHIAPVPPNKHFNHPCPFPEEIPYRLISLFSFPGDAVLDPFLGTGTTTKVARHLGREWYGYDIREEYVRFAESRLSEPLDLRDQLVPRYENVPGSGTRRSYGCRRPHRL